jgi:hypothetical protein
MGLTSLDRPRLDDLKADTWARFQAKFGIVCARPVPRNNLYVLSQVVAGIRDMDWGWRDYIADQIIPDLATGIYLERWAGLLGCARAPAAKACGDVEFTGVIGTSIPIGTRVVYCDGREYKTTALGSIPDEDGIILAACALESGSAGNLIDDSRLQMASTVPGINVDVTVVNGGMTGGRDLQTDFSLQQCVGLKMSTGCAPGQIDTIIAQMRTCNPGVTRAWVKDADCGCGCGSISVYFVMEETYPDTWGIPLPGDLSDMQECLEAVKVAGTHIQVRPIGAVPCDVTVTGLTPDTPRNRKTVKDNIATALLAGRELGVAPCERLYWDAMSATGTPSCAVVIDGCSGANFRCDMLPVPGRVNFLNDPAEKIECC